MILICKAHRAQHAFILKEAENNAIIKIHKCTFIINIHKYMHISLHILYAHILYIKHVYSICCVLNTVNYVTKNIGQMQYTVTVFTLFFVALHL